MALNSAKSFVTASDTVTFSFASSNAIDWPVAFASVIGRGRRWSAGLESAVAALGGYTVSARAQGRVFRRAFTVRAGENAEVEVMMQP